MLSQSQLANYDLIISTTDSTEELLSFVNLCKIQKNGKLLIISDLEDKILKKHNLDFSLHTAFDEVDLIMNVNRLLSDFNQKVKLMEIKKKIYSKRIAKKEFKPISNDQFIKSQIIKAESFAEQRKNVFISGPKGSGKTRFTDFIFNCSPIKNKHYLYVDCKNFSEPHISELLFENKSGGKHYSDYLNEKFQGVILLDQLTSLSLELQSSLAERLKVIYKNKNDKNLQIISTSIHPKENTEKEFLLLPTLANFLCKETIILTPLAERKEDVVLLFNHFQKLFADKYHLVPKVLSKNFQYLLTTYSWPQNIEQLKIVVKKFCFFGEYITEKEFKKMIDSSQSAKMDIDSFISLKSHDIYYTPKFLQENL